MANAVRSPVRHVGGVLLIAVALSLAIPAAPASAEGLFQALFGAFQRHAPEPLPRQSTSYADPLGMFGDQRPAGEASGSGHGTVYCVRTCDGRYFPIPQHGSASPAALCKSFCPAAQTMVFSGSRIDTAIAQNGTRYADLDNAFAYRDKMNSQCTCNGKDGLGLARVDPPSDPTLRPGDIVATDSGLATYTGKSKTGEFTPINTSPGEWARKLSEVKVEPAPPGEKIEPVADAGPRPPRRGRVHAAR